MPQGLGISTAGVIRGTIPANASDGGPYSVAITGTDSQGGTVTQSFVWDVTNPTPTATDDAFTVVENASLSGNVISDNNGNGADTDPDGDALVVQIVNGLGINVGNGVTGSGGGLFTINSDGS